MTPISGWAWFADGQTAPAADPPPFLVRCFSTPDGRRTLEFLKATTLDRAVGPHTGDAALRHLEGQRCLVALLLALVARGRGESPDPSSSL